MPAERQFGSWMGFEWQVRLAELPDTLAVNVQRVIIPTIRALCQHPIAPEDLSTFEREALRRAMSNIELCDRYRAKIERAASMRPRRTTLLTALGHAELLLKDALMLLSDIRWVADPPRL